MQPLNNDQATNMLAAFTRWVFATPVPAKAHGNLREMLGLAAKARDRTQTEATLQVLRVAARYAQAVRAHPARHDELRLAASYRLTEWVRSNASAPYARWVLPQLRRGGGSGPPPPNPAPAAATARPQLTLAQARALAAERAEVANSFMSQSYANHNNMVMQMRWNGSHGG
jgi:hypothetical protein